MDSNNLATLFAPNILHSSNANPQDQMTAQATEERIDVINVIRTMIDHNKALFQVTQTPEKTYNLIFIEIKVSAELLDDVYVHMLDKNPAALDLLLSKRDTSSEE